LFPAEIRYEQIDHGYWVLMHFSSKKTYQNVQQRRFNEVDSHIAEMKNEILSFLYDMKV
jgi:hypothetical protein